MSSASTHPQQPQPPRLLRLTLLALQIVGIWIFLAFALLAPEEQMLWGDEVTVHLTLSRALVWSLFTPIIVACATWFPIRGARWRRDAVIAAVSIVFFACFRELFGTWLKQLVIDPEFHWDEFFGAMQVRFYFNISIVSMIFAGTNVVQAQREAEDRRQRETRLETELAVAQLQQLRADLSPHFLFNAMNAVATLVHTDPDAADRMIVNLSRLLRRALDVSQRNEITLGDELELTRAYLAVQQIRFGARLRVILSVEDDVLGVMVPPLLLQPLAENAIIHGIAKREDGGRIEIRALADGLMLRLQVRDDGPGCDGGTAFSSRSIGLPNTRSRLEHMYRENHRFALRREGSEFVVDIALPLGGALIPNLEIA